MTDDSHTPLDTRALTIGGAAAATRAASELMQHVVDGCQWAIDEDVIEQLATALAAAIRLRRATDLDQAEDDTLGQVAATLRDAGLIE